MNRTYSPKKGEIDRNWYVVDASGLPMGRVCTEVARLLTGKHKPQYAPHVDTGDFVIVINAEKTVLTGRKEEQKIYHRYTGYVGGHYEDSPRTLRERAPERLIEFAVKGMLPRNRLGRKIYKKLKVYADAEHPHEAQSPEAVKLA